MKSNVDLKRVLQEKQKLLGIASEESSSETNENILDRIPFILDSNSFVEMYSMLSEVNKTSGLTAGFGTVNNRPVYLIMQNSKLNNGAVSILQAKKFSNIVKSAMETGVPIILTLDSAGVDLENGVLAMDAYSEMYAALSNASGICPIICVVNGNCYGGNAILSQLCDFVIAIDNKSQISMFGPQVICATEGPDTKIEDVKNSINENNKLFASVVCDSEENAFSIAKFILSFLPDSNSDIPEYIAGTDLNQLTSLNDGSSAQEILDSISDSNSYIKFYEHIDKSLCTALARIGGHSVMLIISDNDDSNGVLTPKALEKASRMISIADSFNIPIISFVNSKGLSIGCAKSQQEIIKSQANFVYSYASATVPKISIVMGNAIGQVFASLVSKKFNDIVYALPEAVISALAPEVAIQLLWQDKIKESNSEISKSKEELAQDYIEKCASSIVAAKNGLVDDIIDPKYIRMHIIYALEMLFSKNSLEYSKKHGNLPK